METNQELLKEFIHNVFEKYKHYVKDKLQKKLKKQVSDSELEKGLQVILEGNNFDEKISVIFADYGRIIDQKRRFQNPAPPIAELEAWVREKGLQNFDYVSGYKYENVKRLPTYNKSVTRIALGIGYGMKIKVNRKPWFASPMYKSIGWLIRSLASGMSRNIGKEVVNNLEIS